MTLDELLGQPTAVVTSELQRGVVLEPAVFPALAEQVADEGLLGRLEVLLAAARGSGVPVLHGVAHRLADGRGANTNARLFAAAARAGVTLEPGSEAAEIVPSLRAEDDLVSGRLHGLGPFAGTDLDALLRNLRIQTVVVVGVSVNVAVTNLVMDLVNGGYEVVLPTDGVTGIPRSFVDQMIVHTLSLLATVTTCDDLVQRWSIAVSDGSSGSA